MNEKQIISNIQKGDIVTLSRLITMCESSLLKEQKIAQSIITHFSKKKIKSIRIGITGIPGVGKSTFINMIGKKLTDLGKKVAILAIDPTSEKSHGSILGDKSRMHDLVKKKDVFIRPSPAGETLGGIAYKTKDNILLCEAAGYDIILIETVGVGQNETKVSKLVDFFLLLMIPGAGDELQGIKRGIVEMADLILFNKADGDNIQNANIAMAQYKNALNLYPIDANGWKTRIKTCSSLEGTGIDDVWETIQLYISIMKKNDYFNTNRKNQEIFWLHNHLKEELGRKKFLEMKSSGKINQIEENIKRKNTSIYDILKELL